MKKKMAVLILAAVTTFALTACDLPFGGLVSSTEEEDERPERKKADGDLQGLTSLFGGNSSASTDPGLVSIDPDPIESSKAYDSDFAFYCYDVNGNYVELAEIMATPELTMVNVWASWCGPCVGELQEIDALSKKYADDGLAIVGILYDSEEDTGLSDGLDIIEYFGLTYTNLRKPAEFDYVYDLEYFPTTFFLDSDGKFVCEEVIGADPESYEKIITDRLGK